MKVLIDFTSEEELQVAHDALLMHRNKLRMGETFVVDRPEPLTTMLSRDICPAVLSWPPRFDISSHTIMDPTGRQPRDRALAPPPVLVMRVRRQARRTIDQSHKWDYSTGINAGDKRRVCSACGQREVYRLPDDGTPPRHAQPGWFADTGRDSRRYYDAAAGRLWQEFVASGRKLPGVDEGA